MHCLSGTYLKEITQDLMLESVEIETRYQFYPVKIAIPPNKSRLIYFLSSEEQGIWLQRLQHAMGYSNVFDFYEL